MQHLLEAVEFRNPSRAREDIARLGGGIPERIAARIQSLLASVPDPDEALHFLERLRQDSPAAFNRITSSPAALRCLITAFSYSRFLSEAVLRRPEWMLQAADPGDLHRMLSAEEFAERLLQFRAAEGPDVPAPVLLARFRRRQSLRILLRDVWAWPPWRISPASCPTWPTPFWISRIARFAGNWRRVMASRFSRDRMASRGPAVLP